MNFVNFISLLKAIRRFEEHEIEELSELIARLEHRRNHPLKATITVDPPKSKGK